MNAEPHINRRDRLAPFALMLGVLTALAAAAAMKIAASVLVPLILAIFLCYLLAPLVSWLGRHRVPPILSVPTALVILLGFVVLVQVVVIETVSQVADQAPTYAERLESLAAGLLDKLGPLAPNLDHSNWLNQVSGALANAAVSVFGSVLDFAFKLALVATYTLFILLGLKSISANLSRALPEERSERVRSILSKINHQVQRYLVVKILLSFATGLSMYVVLLLFDVDFAIFWGLLGFLLNFIPTIGSVIAVLFPIVIALVQFDSLLRVAGVAVSLIAIQQVTGNLIEPSVLGRRLNMSPIIVLFALVFFGWLWGFWGAVLSVPLMAVLKIIFEHTEKLKPVAIMLEK